MNSSLNKSFSISFSLLLMVLITGWTFFQCHSFGYVDYDDPAYITGNPYVNSGLDAQNIKWAFTYAETKGAPLHDGVSNLYHPVTWISHMIDIECFGADSPGAQHLMNLVIHVLAGIILFFIFLKLLGNQVVALMTALLFCIHPLHVESVAWLSERKDTLSALFTFASILCYQFYSENQKTPAKCLSICLFILALLSKPSVVILPGILMLIDQYQKHQMNKWDLDFVKKQLIDKAGWNIPAFVVALAAITFQQGGSQGDFMNNVGFFDRLVQIPTRLSYYLYHIFNPTSLSFHYAAPTYDGKILSTISSILLIGLTVFAYKIRERFPLAIFALLWFYICIIPMSGVVHVGTSFIADRYTYLAIIGIFACISAAIIKFIPKHLGYSILMVIVVTCAWLAHQQTKVWKDSYALFSNAIAAQPRDALSYTNLGAKYKLDGDLDKAITLFNKAIEIAPQDYIAHHNLAHIYLAQKQWSMAERYFLNALDRYENYHPSMKALAELYMTESKIYDLDQALIYTNRYNNVVRERDPQMLGIEIELLLKLKKYEEAKSVARRLQQHPDLTPEARQFIESILESN